MSSLSKNESSSSLRTSPQVINIWTNSSAPRIRMNVLSDRSIFYYYELKLTYFGNMLDVRRYIHDNCHLFNELKALVLIFLLMTPNDWDLLSRYIDPRFDKLFFESITEHFFDLIAGNITIREVILNVRIPLFQIDNIEIE